ncbi:MAG: cupredoxin domain-containing protein, partial [Chloroflexota bacterium]
GGESAASDAVTVTSYDIYFDPATVTVPAEKEVTVTLPNAGAAPHNFSIDALKVNVDLSPGETKEAKFTAPAGEYEYYCNVPGHKEAGMIGTLTAK